MALHMTISKDTRLLAKCLNSVAHVLLETARPAGKALPVSDKVRYPVSKT